MHADQRTSDLIYTYICDYIQQHGYSPSIRNIARDCRLGKSTVHYTLNKLEAWGWVTREPGVARSLHVLREKKRQES